MKKYKINLHAHSNYSDGGNIEDLATKYKEMGFVTATVTDHVYWWDIHVSLTMEKYLAQKNEAQKISRKLDFPFIVGAEFETKEREEFLVFGDEAIRALLMKREKWVAETNKGNQPLPLFIKDMIDIKNNYNCAIILCHPHLKPDYSDNEIKFFKNNGFIAIHGYERYNSGYDMFKTDEKKPFLSKFSDITAFSNSDAHSDSSLDKGYNFFTEPIGTEAELIDYIQKRKPVEMYSLTK